MKQLALDNASGRARLLEVPRPAMRAGGVLVRTRFSLVSPGTERSKVELARKSLVAKARARPDLVQKVLDSVARDGLPAAVQKVRSRLRQLGALGYSSSGVIEAIGEGVTGLEVGMHVACGGADYAVHGEYAWVPQNLVVPVPLEVPLEEAAFTTLGAIALHGVRQADVKLGETAVVIGLGLVGQLTVQLLRCAGVNVIGIDTDPDRVDLARAYATLALMRGDDPEAQISAHTSGHGADAVLITAAADSDDPIRLAGQVARDRARVVVVGAVPMRIPRELYYHKELELRLSRSYGPGRYDPAYEEKGQDYPIGYVRWTQRRNMHEFVHLLSTQRLDVLRLITHRVPFGDAEERYQQLVAGKAARVLAVLLEYSAHESGAESRIVLPSRTRRGGKRVRIGLIGAGNFAQGTLLPRLQKLGVEFHSVSSGNGLRARSAAEQFGFRYVASDTEALLADPEIDAVIVATRHNEHASLAARALRADKAVYVEKPLALDDASLEDVLAAATGGPILMVGFNRRFAPATAMIRKHLDRTAGLRIAQIRVNAGRLPHDSWINDPAIGGGRLIGEGCHFVDLALYLMGSPLREVSAHAVPVGDAHMDENFQITLRCENGSMASVVYTSVGNTQSGKERIEVFAGGSTSVIDDFRQAEFAGTRTERWRGSTDKGHAEALRRFVDAVVSGGAEPIPLEELANSSRATLAAYDSLRNHAPVQV